MTRGALKADVERNISKNVIVIADSLNYIKGIISCIRFNNLIV